jgi:lipoyl(octanoyl) transferase
MRLAGASAAANGVDPLEWQSSPGLVPYGEALAAMESRVEAIITHQAPELVWLLEHPPLYTAGTSARAQDLLQADFPVHQTGRGGQYTYHGPGQRIAYVMLDLRGRKQDLRCYVHDLESWVIAALRRFDVDAQRREGRIGLWIDLARHGRIGEAKIAAIGVRVRRWVTFHGVSINVAPDLSHYNGIVPCGISQHGVTSLADLGIDVTMADMDAALKDAWGEVF